MTVIHSTVYRPTVRQGLSHTHSSLSAKLQIQIPDSDLTNTYFTALILIVFQDYTGMKKADLAKNKPLRSPSKLPVFRGAHFDHKAHPMPQYRAGWKLLFVEAPVQRLPVIQGTSKQKKLHGCDFGVIQWSETASADSPVYGLKQSTPPFLLLCTILMKITWLLSPSL